LHLDCRAAGQLFLEEIPEALDLIAHAEAYRVE
jgi:hypothetical protein